MIWDGQLQRSLIDGLKELLPLGYEKGRNIITSEITDGRDGPAKDIDDRGTEVREYDVMSFLPRVERNNPEVPSSHPTPPPNSGPHTPPLDYRLKAKGSTVYLIVGEALQYSPTMISLHPVQKFEGTMTRSKRVKQPGSPSLQSPAPVYKPLKPVLAPRPGCSSTFTGHQSHDIYKMLAAKLTARKDLPWGPESYSVVCHSTYPSAPNQQCVPLTYQYPINNGTILPIPKYSSPHRVSHAPLTCHAPATLAGSIQRTLYLRSSHRPASLNRDVTKQPDLLTQLQTEDELRKQTLHYVREHYRPRRREQGIFEDPEATSGPESEDEDDNALNTYGTTLRPSLKPATSASSGLPKDSFTKGQVLTHAVLSSHVFLLNSLLNAYPDSLSKRELREDIAMLITVIDQRFTEWLDSEGKEDQPRPPKRVRFSNNVESEEPEVEVLKEEMIQRPKIEDEVRKYLSASSDIWSEGGNGLGVANVYANEMEKTAGSGQALTPATTASLTGILASVPPPVTASTIHDVTTESELTKATSDIEVEA